MISELPIIDLVLGAELLGSTQETAVKMIKELVVCLHENRRDLDLAYTAADIKKIYSLAHYIHGGVSYCGTPRLKESAFALEKAARVAQSLQDLDAAYQELCSVIQLVIAEGSRLH